jgi:exopolysaccharide biosynthesis WecB/TagA/CpsF family protein
LAVGSPGQEILAAAIQASGRAVGTGLCAGASLDFLAGAAQRAPWLMQRAGLEWLHRMASDPRRLTRRYLHDDPPVFGMLMRERLGQFSYALPGKPLLADRD